MSMKTVPKLEYFNDYLDFFVIKKNKSIFFSRETAICWTSVFWCESSKTDLWARFSCCNLIPETQKGSGWLIFNFTLNVATWTHESGLPGDVYSEFTAGNFPSGITTPCFSHVDLEIFEIVLIARGKVKVENQPRLSLLMIHPEGWMKKTDLHLLHEGPNVSLLPGYSYPKQYHFHLVWS